MDVNDIVVEELEDETLAAGDMTRPGCLASEGFSASA